jgi:hypothetical protein
MWWYRLFKQIDATTSGQPAGQPADSSEAENGGKVIFFKTKPHQSLVSTHAFALSTSIGDRWQ